MLAVERIGDLQNPSAVIYCECREWAVMQRICCCAQELASSESLILIRSAVFLIDIPAALLLRKQLTILAATNQMYGTIQQNRLSYLILCRCQFHLSIVMQWQLERMLACQKLNA